MHRRAVDDDFCTAVLVASFSAAFDGPRPCPPPPGTATSPQAPASPELSGQEKIPATQMIS